MQKLIFILITLLSVLGCKRQSPESYKEVITEYDSAHEEYKLYGKYRRVDIYNGRAYRDSFYHQLYIDDNHYMVYYLNEFGDTITKIFIDTTNYPRREE